MKINKVHIIGIILLSVVVFLQGCSTSKPYAESAIKTFDPDTARIEMPQEQPQYQYWDRIDNTLFHQLEKPLDLNRPVRFMGRQLGINGKRQADNINKLDEVPESSWYTWRHYYNKMSADELAMAPCPIPEALGLFLGLSSKVPAQDFLSRIKTGIDISSSLTAMTIPN